MSILDLFCSVDAFWQRFEPQWERELLRSRDTPASTSDAAASGGDPHHPDPLPAVGVSDLQRVLHPARPGPFAPGVSWAAELLPLRGPDAALPGALGDLPAHPAGAVYGHQLHRLDLARRVPSGADPAAPRLSRRRPARQDVGGLVLRLQTPSGRQRPWRVAGLLPHSWQYRRPPACSTLGRVGSLAPLWRQGLHLRAARRAALPHPGAAPHHQTAQEHAQQLLCPSPTGSCCASARSSRRSSINSRTSARSSTRATAVPSISSSTCSLASSPIATSPRNPRWTSLPIPSSPTLSKTDVAYDGPSEAPQTPMIPLTFSRSRYASADAELQAAGAILCRPRRRAIPTPRAASHS